LGFAKEHGAAAYIDSFPAYPNHKGGEEGASGGPREYEVVKTVVGVNADAGRPHSTSTDKATQKMGVLRSW
jgi:hypothetical protein